MDAIIQLALVLVVARPELPVVTPCLAWSEECHSAGRFA
jgi:hypothetical protein